MNDRAELIERGRQSLAEISEVLTLIDDQEVVTLFGNGSLDAFLRAILDRSKVSAHPSIQDFLLTNRMRSRILAQVQHVITNNYSFLVNTDDSNEVFVSPSALQWFDDGVMYLVGKERFAGLLGLYRNGAVSYGVAARDVRVGEEMGPDHFEFVDVEEARRIQKELAQAQGATLDKPLGELQSLLSERVNDESKYQEILTKYPWIFGAQYSKIQRHSNLDDKNIPDFTGARVHDGCRDIIEIKPPFSELFRGDGKFSSSFHNYWDQAERYLDFATTERDYLYRKKGLRFDVPRCYLVLGYDLTKDQIVSIRRKERNNPSIRSLTYNDLLVFATATVAFIRKLKEQDAPPDSPSGG